MNLYPVFLKLAGQTVAVIGGGEIAARKIEALLECCARVTVISPELNQEIAAWAEARIIRTLPRAYAAGDLSGSVMVIAATDDRQVNEAVAAEAGRLGIPVNVVDVPDLCSFYVPAVYREGDLALAVSTGGGAPALAGAIRRWFDRSGFGRKFAAICRETAARRRELAAAGASMDTKRAVLTPFIRERFRNHGIDWPDDIIEDQSGRS